ncbi:MAG: hypothetical protein IPI81_15550 [Flavobacteriales bacterium]|nr:hypothetical protein [Flavobacteriales bacterium]
MRIPFILCALSLFADPLFAQAPRKMSFQAVLRDNADALIVNGAVGVRASVLQGTINGAAVFVETHTTTTNANGLVTLVIGDGNPVSGTMDAIDWANGPYFLKTETDPNGGSAYTISGTSQLLSVPYALHAANNMQGPAGPQGPQGEPGCNMVRTGNMLCVYTSTNAYGLYQGQSSGSFNNAQWTTIALSGTVLGAEASENTIVIYTTTNAYGLYQAQSSGSLNNAQWTTISLGGNVLGAVSNTNQVAVYTTTNAYGLFQGQTTGGLSNAQWNTISMSGNVLGAAASRHQLVIYTSTNAYAMFQGQSSGNFNNAQWTTTALSGTPIGAEAER